MAPPIVPPRRAFLKSVSLAAGAAAGLAVPVPAVAQRPKLVYWCYQFLKASDDARANFAQEWAKKNNVDLQLTMVPWKEFMPKITAAIEAKATPDVIESGAVELRGRGQLLDVTDIYGRLEKTYGGWVAARPSSCSSPRAGPPHPLRLPGFHGDRARGPAQGGRRPGAASHVGRALEQAKKAQRSPRTFGLGIPVSNQTDSGVWEDIMKSYGARLADDKGKRVVLGDHKREVWEFLDYFTEVWKSGVLPPGVATWDNTMNNSTYQAGKRASPQPDHPSRCGWRPTTPSSSPRPGTTPTRGVPRP